MAQAATFNADVTINGALTCQTFNTGAVITNSMIGAGGTGLGIAASKLEHQFQATVAQAYATTIATFRQSIHLVRGATGTLISFACYLSQACIGDSTVSVQLKKNGSNVLSAALTFSSADAAFALKSTTSFTSTALAVGDYLEVDVTATVGTGTLGKGFFAELNSREDAA